MTSRPTKTPQRPFLPPSSAAQGGAAGFGKGSADVALAAEGQSTRLRYDAKANVGGKLAQIGSRLVDAAAAKITEEFFRSFGLTPEKLALAKPDAIVMHPGPINRGVEIDSAVVDGQQSVILPQVTFGIAVRMAVMGIVAGNEA